MHFPNNQNDTLRCIIFGIYGDGGPKTWHSVRQKIEPATGQVLGSSESLFAWIEEAGQNLQIISRRNNFTMIFEKLGWSILILHNWKGRVHAKASSKIKRLGRSVSQRRMPRETEKPPPLTMIDEKPTYGTITSKKDEDGHGMMKSDRILVNMKSTLLPNEKLDLEQDASSDSHFHSRIE